MKKIKLLVCVFGLFVGFLPTAEAAASDLCGAALPESCFHVIELASGNAERKKRGVGSYAGDPGRPEHCPEQGFTGNSHPTITLVLNEFDITVGGDTETGLKSMQQELLYSCISTDDSAVSCALNNADAGENGIDDEGLTVECKEERLNDGKYGVCTREALRRYLTWYKVNQCFESPEYLIIPAPKIKQSEETNFLIDIIGGKAWEWGSKEKFEAKEMDIIIENTTIKFSESTPARKTDSPFTDSPFIGITENYAITFKSAGEGNIIVEGGNIKGHPSILVKKDEKKFKVIATEATVPKKTDLTCDQLLPKYLVGASCKPELHGDARDITYWIQRFSGQITTFIASLAVLLIAWNAFGLVMASGDSDKIANSKKALMWVGIGLVLTSFAYIIVKTVISLSFLQ